MKQMLIKVLENGQKLSLMDGSVFMVNPGDFPTACTWLPTSYIEVIKDYNDTSFPYTLVNLENNISIKAMKIN